LASRLGLGPIEQQTNALGFDQRAYHDSRAGLSTEPAVPIWIVCQERIKESVNGGPQRIVEFLAHLVSHTLGEINTGEHMDMGKCLAQFSIGQGSKKPHG
jgi:hypothetical protein